MTGYKNNTHPPITHVFKKTSKLLFENNFSKSHQKKIIMSSYDDTGKPVFENGKYATVLQKVEPAGTCTKNSSLRFPPPKQLLIAMPTEGGEFPVLVLLHGYLLSNSFYSQLIHHVASHGFIVIAPQVHIHLLLQLYSLLFLFLTFSIIGLKWIGIINYQDTTISGVGIMGPFGFFLWITLSHIFNVCDFVTKKKNRPCDEAFVEFFECQLSSINLSDKKIKFKWHHFIMVDCNI